MTSASLTEPPGWMIAVTPASAAWSTPSRKGKYASEPMTAPCVSRPAWAALCTARNAASTRDIWPAPMPIVAPDLAITIALDLALATARHANDRSDHSSVVGCRLLTTRHEGRPGAAGGRAWVRGP